MLERKGADNRARCCARCRAWSSRSRCKEGQEVKAGDPLCMVEAMKMENVLLAERDATVKTILAKAGRFAGGRRGDHGVRLTDRFAAQRGRRRLGPLNVC